MRKAIEIADRVLLGLSVNEGQTEKEIAEKIRLALKKNGARPAFRIIVASGKRSALPHGFASEKIIKKGELLVVDFGAVYNKFRSDITRTFIIGKPAAKQRKIYRIVKEAQRQAIRALKAGKPCFAVDAAAREYIDRQGFGKYFIHSTGHGILKRVHQAPKISRKNRRKLKAGMVVTIEPGIYIKGWGGVRIEDMLLVTKTGSRRLTKSAYKF